MTESLASDGPACTVEHSEPATAAHSVSSSTRLADHTTLRLGGEATELVIATSESELIAAVQGADRVGQPVLVLSGGSNLVIGDDGFDGRVVRVATRGVSSDVSDCAGAMVSVEAGENWDDLVALAVANEWIGIETLSGIPGLVGSTPIQNVGAYGAEVSDTIARVRAFDRHTGQIVTFAAADCGFAYRHSRFKAEFGRYLILQVTFQFELGALSGRIRYPELAKALGVEVGERAPLAEVREQVLHIRSSKGMVLDADDHDSWSAGSFFMNPLLDEATAAALPDEAPRYPAQNGLIKTSAAWLIQHAGFEKGHSRGRVSLSTKHTLALTNRGGATTADLLALAAEVRDGVNAQFGIQLQPEPVLVGCSF